MQQTWEVWVQSLGREAPLEEGMATHSSVLARRIPWAEEPGGLQSLWSQRFGHDCISTGSQASLEATLEGCLPAGRQKAGCSANNGHKGHWRTVERRVSADKVGEEFLGKRLTINDTYTVNKQSWIWGCLAPLGKRVKSQVKSVCTMSNH